jgi:hypothetical protein
LERSTRGETPLWVRLRAAFGWRLRVALAMLMLLPLGHWLERKLIPGEPSDWQLASGALMVVILGVLACLAATRHR